MNLAKIATDLDNFAEAAVASAVAEGRTFVAQEVGEAKQALEDTASNAAEDFADLVSKVGADAAALVTALEGDLSLPLASEQENLAATTLISNSAAKGITVLETDASTIIRNTYLAVSAKIAAL